MKRIIIKNGAIVDPERKTATVGDLVIENGRVKEVIDLTMSHEQRVAEADMIDASNCVVAPGFIDLHCHLREPGYEDKETISTGSRAAARGGFTHLCMMPDTEPALDSAAAIRNVLELVRRDSQVEVLPIGAVTLRRAGTTLSEMVEMAEAGAIAFSDEGSPLEDTHLMRQALQYSRMVGRPIMSHCEDRRLVGSGMMNEGPISYRLGLPGWPAAAEESMVARNLALAELTGGKLHICHVSTAGSVRMIREARARGVNVTAEVTPHHLMLSDEWVLGSLAPERKRTTKNPYNPRLLSPYDARTKVSPPLRTDADREALLDGLRDGTIDAIATDHEPHTLVDKECEYGHAAFGVSSLETALPLLLTLVHSAQLDMVDLIAALTVGQARISGVVPISLGPGDPATLTIFDPHAPWTVSNDQLVSLGKNTPLIGQKMQGRVMLTMIQGRTIFSREGFGKGAGGRSSRIEGVLEPEDDEEL